jgi:hypothetical protein
VNAHVAELGMQREFQAMLQHTRQAVPGLRAVRVTLEYDPACPATDPGVVIRAHREEPGDPSQDRADCDWSEWKLATFPPRSAFTS